MTPIQLRTSNIIFLEHERMKLEIPIYQKQIKNYKLLDSLAVKHDSILKLQIYNLNKELEIKTSKIKKLKLTRNIGIGAAIALFGILWIK